MQPSSLIFVLVVAIWAVYLLQYWIKRRDHLSTVRSVDRFSAAMRVLDDHRLRRESAEPNPRSYSVAPVRAARPEVTVKHAEAPQRSRLAEPVVGAPRRVRGLALLTMLVLLPVAIGMWLRSVRPQIAERAERPIKAFAIVFLVVVAIGAIVAERDNIVEYTRSAGLLVTILCALALSVGYAVARGLRLDRAQGVAAAYEVGIQNTTLAMTLALSVMGSTEIAIPAAVYSIVMNIFGFAFGIALGRMPERAVAPAV